MARFAVFYNRSDLAAVAAEVQNISNAQGFTSQDKQTATRLWNGGLQAWSLALPATGNRPNGNPYQDSADPLDPTLVLVLDGPQISKAQMIALMRKVCSVLPVGSQYMCAIADDMESTAVEPWTS